AHRDSHGPSVWVDSALRALAPRRPLPYVCLAPSTPVRIVAWMARHTDRRLDAIGGRVRSSIHRRIVNRLRPVTFALPAFAFALGSASAAAQPQSARAVSERALHAVEGDSSAALRAEWEREVRTGAPSAPHAELGLATLDALTYRFEDANRRFEALRRTAADSAVLARAALGLGGVRQAQGPYRHSREPLQQANVVARAIGDSATQ